MKKDIKPNLERIIKKTKLIINSKPDEVESEYSKFISEYDVIEKEWNKLKGKIDNWKTFNFSKEKDFIKYTCGCYTFSTQCKNNMQDMRAICEDNLSKLKEMERKPLLSTGQWIAIIGIIVAIFGMYSSNNGQIRYDQGRQEMRNELADTLNVQQNTIQNLLDTLEKIKLRNEELEKCIKLKKSCK